jgi:hypothetical protein
VLCYLNEDDLMLKQRLRPVPVVHTEVGLFIGRVPGTTDHYVQVCGPDLNDVETIANHLRRRGLARLDASMETGRSKEGWAARWTFDTEYEAETIGEACANILGRELVTLH